MKKIPTLSDKDKARFWKRIVKGIGDECWKWTGAKAEGGYGHIWLIDHAYHAQRISWFIHSGQDPNQSLVLHKCDNPECCNPDHLFLGTHADNAKDRELKQRGASTTKPDCYAKGERHRSRTHPESLRRGERSPQSKLRNEDVLAMRRYRRENPNVSLNSIAQRFHIGRQQASDIISGKAWRHLA